MKPAIWDMFVELMTSMAVNLGCREGLTPCSCTFEKLLDPVFTETSNLDGLFCF